MHFRRAWLIWLGASVALTAYCGLAMFVARTDIASVELTPGKTIDVTSFRLFDHSLSFQLRFKRSSCTQTRPELGDWADRGSPDRISLTPGAEVLISASSASNPKVEFEAMPKSSYNCESISRTMTANRSIEPGVYRWPPPASTPSVKLAPGFNTIRFEVTGVDPVLAGETVSLYVQPPLGFKVSQPNLKWLHFGLLWPVFIGTQLIWAFGIIVLGWLQRWLQDRRNRLV